MNSCNLVLFLLSIYRPHNDSIENFVDRLSLILNNDILRGKKVVIMGDLNINLLLQNPQVELFCTEMYSQAFIPHISKPTRFPPQGANINPSLLDHIWSNCFLDCRGGIFTLELSDHLPCFLRIPINNAESNEKVKLSFRSHGIANLNRFVECLSEVNWVTILIGDASENFLVFDRTVNKLYNKCFPLKIKFVSHKRLRNQWISSDIMQAIKVKSNNFKCYKSGTMTKSEYTRFNNRLKNTIRRSKKNYYENKFEQCRSDLRSTWKIIRTILGGSSRGRIKSIMVNGENVEDEEMIAGAFNDYFTTVASDLDRLLPDSTANPMNYVHSSVVSSMFLNPVTAVEIDSVIMSQKKKSNRKNTLPLSILSACRQMLCDVIAYLVNDSFDSGVFPQLLKRAEIVPVFKSGDPKLVYNYRPISLLPLMSKIYERCMYNRLLSFLIRHSILSTDQFGFRRGRSTVDAIGGFVERIYRALNNSQYVISTFVDLKKAFDTVNHRILLDKLFKYGVRGLPLQWFASYLRDREHCVRIGDAQSEYKTLNISIPQGSILGPLLFIIYINDLPSVTGDLSTVLFADDTTLFCSGPDFPTLVNKCNVDLVKVSEWLVANRLTLNINKTFSMIFSNRQYEADNYSIRIDNEIIPYVSSGKFLGVVMDRFLKFDNHVSEICGKLSKSVGILKKLREYIPGKQLIDLYYNFAYPYLVYCNLVWGKTNDTHLKSLRTPQKKIIRIVTNQHYLSHTSPLFKQLGILKLPDIFNYLLEIYMFKLVSSQPVEASHNYSTRSASNIRPAYQRLTLTQ